MLIRNFRVGSYVQLILRRLYCILSYLISEIISRFPLSLHEDQNVVIELASHKSSSRDLVGLQLWRGAFLLAEYLCHRQDLVKNSNILELAAGTGFTSIVAALTAKKVICTGM